jgi:hypothetical protein
MLLFVFLSLNLETTFSKLREGAEDVDAMAKPARISKEPDGAICQHNPADYNRLLPTIVYYERHSLPSRRLLLGNILTSSTDSLADCDDLLTGGCTVPFVLQGVICHRTHDSCSEGKVTVSPARAVVVVAGKESLARLDCHYFAFPSFLLL